MKFLLIAAFAALTAGSAQAASFVSCADGKFSIDKAADGGLTLRIADAEKLAHFEGEGWMRPAEIQDGAFTTTVTKGERFYRFFGSAQEVGGVFYEVRWDESRNPPRYAFIELWRVYEGGSMAPLEVWEFGDSCRFAETDGHFSLPPPPPEPYTIDREADAGNCELFINSLGRQNRHYGGGGYDERLFVAYVSVDAQKLVTEQGGEILAVGMRMNGTDDLIERNELEPAYYMLRKSLWLRGYNNADYDLHRFAVFVDVRRADRSVDRLWLKDGWHDFNWPSVFADYPKHVKSMGPNYDEYVLDPSPVYGAKARCN